jgi:hypothetical protein
MLGGLGRDPHTCLCAGGWCSGCLAVGFGAHVPGDCLVGTVVRRMLGVQQWVMLGGSWGVTLTLAYAQGGRWRCRGRGLGWVVTAQRVWGRGGQ